MFAPTRPLPLTHAFPIFGGLGQRPRRFELRGLQTHAEPPVPQVGWLWERRAADTKRRLREQNIRPKK